MRRSAKMGGMFAVFLLGAASACLAQGTGTGTPPTAPNTDPESSGRPAEETPAPGAVTPPVPTPAPRPTAPPPFRFSGYIRSTFANTENGDNAKPFQLPGAPTKYRLGNEPEHYGEFSFTGNHTLRSGLDRKSVV